MLPGERENSKPLNESPSVKNKQVIESPFDNISTIGPSISNPINKALYKQKSIQGGEETEILNEILNGDGVNPNTNKETITDYGNGVDERFLDDVQLYYAKALDSVGLNISDPLSAYSTHFNTYGQTLGLDPQLPGGSYVFITRPMLNLSIGNLRYIPIADWFSQTPIGKIVVNLLQYPKIRTSSDYASVQVDNAFKCDSVFDPLKSNCCTEISGLKDFVMEKYDTEGDFAGNQLTYADGSDGIESIGEVSVTYEDPIHSPIFMSHLIHFLYIQNAVKGIIRPYRAAIEARVIDYTFSIYIFKLARDNETIIRFAKLTGCYPLNVPMGSLSHNKTDRSDDQYNTVNVSYAYNRYEPMNPAIIKDFNLIALKGIISDAERKEINWANPEIKFNYSPKKLIEPDPRITSENTRSKFWSRAPYIKDNKLLFV